MLAVKEQMQDNYGCFHVEKGKSCHSAFYRPVAKRNTGKHMNLEGEIVRLHQYCKSRRNMSARSASTIARCIKTFVGTYSVTAPTEDGLRRLADGMEQRGVEPTTRRFYIQAFEKWAEAQGRHIDIKEVIPQAPRLKQPIIKTIPRADVEPIIDACPDVRDRAMLATGFYAGLRVSEICRLRLNCLSFDEGIIYVRNEGSDTTKSRRERPAPLVPELQARLKEWLAVRNEYLIDKGKNSDLVFVTNRGTAMTPGNVRQRFDGHKKRLGIEKLNPHLLRHTCASTAIKSHIDNATLKEVFGWQSLDMAARYAHATKDEIRDSFRKFRYS